MYLVVYFTNHVTLVWFLIHLLNRKVEFLSVYHANNLRFPSQTCGSKVINSNFNSKTVIDFFKYK